MRRIAGTVAALFAAAALAAAERRPNVVVILADDLGYGDLGFNGCRDIPTPSIDALARRGVRLSNGYVSHPFCSPTRAGLVTGRYQQRFGHENNPAFEPGNTRLGLPLTLAAAYRGWNAQLTAPLWENPGAGRQRQPSR